jgi:hypothetical protein
VGPAGDERPVALPIQPQLVACGAGPRGTAPIASDASAAHLPGSDASSPTALLMRQQGSSGDLVMSEAVMGGGHGVFAERQTIVGRPMSQGLLGIATIILGIVGLAIGAAHPDVPVYLDAIAAIILGVSLVAAGAGFAVAYARLAARSEGTDAVQAGGINAGIFLGSSVVVLGILSVLRVAASALVPIAVIVVGVGLIMSGGASVRLAMLEGELEAERPVGRRVGEEMAFATASMRAIAGIAVVVLGIVALAGADALVVTLAAMIVAGAAMLMNGAPLSSRMVNILVRRRV